VILDPLIEIELIVENFPANLDVPRTASGGSPVFKGAFVDTDISGCFSCGQFAIG
jgi:hypothetical protein